MHELARKPAVVRTRRRVEPLQKLRKTLRAHTSASGVTTASSTRTSTIATCASSFRMHPIRGKHEGGPVHRPHSPRRTPHGRLMDRRIPSRTIR